MSKPPNLQYQPQEPPHLNLSDDPTIKGKDGALRWYREEMGISGMRMNWIVSRTNDRRLPSHLIGTAVYYSTRDLWRAVVMQTRRSADETVSA